MSHVDALDQQTTTEDVAARVVAVVLSDSARAEASAAAESARTFADHVVVLERTPSSCDRTDPAGVEVVTCDWHDGDAAIAALAALAPAWVLVLDASERLEVRDPAAARTAIAAGMEPLGIEHVGRGVEVRLAAVAPGVLDAIGQVATEAVPGLAIVPSGAPSSAPAAVVRERPLGERHLLVVWENARDAADAIVGDLGHDFHVRARVRMAWSPRNFGSNLSRFYGQKLPADGEKATHIGTGPFEVLLVEDPSPAHAPQMTSSGIAVVNARILAAKNRYRAATGGGHRIHGTTTAEEAVHDGSLLLGLDYEEFFNAGSGADRVLDIGVHDLLGADGFADVRQLFALLDRTMTYVVLRNFEDMPDGVTLTGHDDVDLLVRNCDETALLLDATRVFADSWRTHWTVRIGENDVPFDLRYVGDGYYPTPLQEQLLAARTRWQDAMWVPSEVLYFNTLLYHALVHKVGVSDDYRLRLTAMLDRLVGTTRHAPLSDGELVGLLARWLGAQGLQVTHPFDQSVHYHPQVVGLLHQGATKLWPDAGQGASTWR